MQREALEFHDSVLTSVERSGDALRLLFEPAYVHRSSGEPARDAGTGWSVNAQLTLFGVDECQISSDIFGDVWEGSLRSFERISTNALPSGILFTTYKAAGALKT